MFLCGFFRQVQAAKKNRIVAALLISLATCCLLTIVLACAVSGLLTQSKKGLTISPIKKELNVTPGTVVNGYLVVENTSDGAINVDLKADEFSVINQQYDYAFTEESEVSKWVTFKEKSASLKAGETKKIFYDVSIPQSAEPGGYYVGLFVGTSSGSSDEGIISEQRIASLLYITVLGDVSRVGRLVSIVSPWLSINHGEWSALLKNEGTTHYRSRYNVTFYSLFGQIASKTKTGEALILPGTIRLITDNFDMPKWPGLYKASFVIGLGDTPSETAVRYLLFLPPWSIGLILIVVVMTILLMRKLKPKKNQSV